jgi:hypothetical protein
VKLIDLATQSIGFAAGSPFKTSHGGAVGSVSQVPVLLGMATLKVVLPLRLRLFVQSMPPHPVFPVSLVVAQGAQRKNELVAPPVKSNLWPELQVGEVEETGMPRIWKSLAELSGAVAPFLMCLILALPARSIVLVLLFISTFSWK